MYIIGNAELARQVKMLDQVVGILQTRNQIGPELRLHCSRHQKKYLGVTKPEDFERIAPEGGCTEKCGKQLDCGHVCEISCHTESRHKIVECHKLCQKNYPECGHHCPKLCREVCGQCEVPVTDVLLPCGHRLPKAECWLSRNLNHPKAKCLRKVVRQLKRCNHSVQMRCSDNPDEFKCTKQCELRCIHSQCPGKCGRDCVPCIQPCDWKCIHMGDCTMPCGAPCNRLPCDEHCSKLLKCGHRCPSVCGEICPSSGFCQICGSRREKLVGSIKFSKVDLDQDPIIVLSCQHFYTRSYLDEMFEIRKAYVRNENGQYFKSVQMGCLWLQPKQCPQCSMQISNFHRYNHNIKRTLLDNILRCTIIRSEEQFVAVSRYIDTFEIELEKNRKI